MSLSNYLSYYNTLYLSKLHKNYPTTSNVLSRLTNISIGLIGTGELIIYGSLSLVSIVANKINKNRLPYVLSLTEYCLRATAESAFTSIESLARIKSIDYHHSQYNSLFDTLFAHIAMVFSVFTSRAMIGLQTNFIDLLPTIYSRSVNDVYRCLRSDPVTAELIDNILSRVTVEDINILKECAENDTPENRKRFALHLTDILTRLGVINENESSVLINTINNNGDLTEAIIPILRRYGINIRMEGGRIQINRETNVDPTIDVRDFVVGDKKYQDALLKYAYLAKEYFQEKQLYNHLEGGIEDVEGLAPAYMLAIAHLAQLIELSETDSANACPETFEHPDLKRYDHVRVESIRRSRDMYNILTNKDKQELEIALIKGNEKEELADIYREITTLSSALHQGPLLTKWKIRITVNGIINETESMYTALFL